MPSDEEQARYDLRRKAEEALYNKIVELERRMSALESENGVRIFIKDTTGDPSTGNTGVICINTFNNNIKIYAEGAWRTIGTY